MSPPSASLVPETSEPGTSEPGTSGPGPIGSGRTGDELMEPEPEPEPAGAEPGSVDDWDDATLVGRSTSGDDEAFSALVRRYQGPLYRHAWRLTQDRRTAEDVVQEAFVTAWRRLPTLAQPGSFRSWAYQITTRRSIDAIRARRPEQLLDVQAEVGVAAGLAAPGPGPASQTEHRGQLDALAVALQELPVAQRAAWSMREIDGLSYDEIATALGLPVSTVRGRIARARHELAERMSAWQTTRD